MHTPDQKWIAMTLRSICELAGTCEELKLAIGKVHERVLGEDSDKVIGEINHRVKQRVQQLLIEFEEKNPEFAAVMDDLGRPGDQTPPSPPL
jgi:hypothetical protein